MLCVIVIPMYIHVAKALAQWVAVIHRNPATMSVSVGWWSDAPSAAGGKHSGAPSKRKHGKANNAGAGPGPAPKAAAGGKAAQLSVVLPSDPRLAEVRARAQAALDADAVAFDKERRDAPSGDDRWMRSVMAGGTLTDKIAAMALLVQQAPLQSLRTLDVLVSLAKKTSRRESQLAGDTLADLFANSLLPGVCVCEWGLFDFL